MTPDATFRHRCGSRHALLIAGIFIMWATLAPGSASAAEVRRGEVAAEQSSTPGPESDGPAAPTGDLAPSSEHVDEAPESIDPIGRAMVVLYGDSLAWEARDAFVMSFAGRAEVAVRTFGGTAICDWLETMAADAVRMQPGVVVVEFSGNNFTSCMLGPDGAGLRDGALVDRYRADAESVIALFVHHGTQVVFAGSPTAGAASDRPVLNQVYERLADEHDGVHYVDAGAAVLDEGRWTATLPCLPAEPCEGGVDADGTPVSAVRAPDGMHFCPVDSDAVDGVTGACPVWSSGAFRFGAAMAAPVVAALDAARDATRDVAASPSWGGSAAPKSV
jgi:hypothetical protein